MGDSRNRVYLDDLIPKCVRLGRNFIRRIDEARKSRGQTFQTFVQAALVKAVAEANAEGLQAAQQRNAERNKNPVHAPKGLGIRDRLEQLDDTIDESFTSPEDERSAPSPVTVNVHAAPPAGGGELQALARMVLDGPPHERDRRLQSACNSLARTSRTPEDAYRLADQLDAEIKRLDVPTSALDRVRARRKK